MKRLCSDSCAGIFYARTNPIEFKGLTHDVTNGLLIKLAAHVDDLIITTNIRSKFLEWMKVLETHFVIKYSELTTAPTDYMSLSLSYDRASRKLHISQKRYIQKVLGTHGLLDSAGVNTPMIVDHDYSTATQPEEVNGLRRKSYRNIVATANWVVQFTNPEVTCAISILSRYLENPSANMHKGAIRILRYFKWKLDMGLEGLVFDGMPFKNASFRHPTFGHLKRNQIYAWSDASYLPKELADKSRSRGGDVQMTNGMLLLCICAILTNICMSATEAEYRQLSQAARRTLFLRAMAEELGEPQQGPTLIAEDNKGAIAIAENPGQHQGRRKHVAVDVHFIQQYKTIQLKYCRTLVMLADILTKALNYTMCAPFASELTGIKFPKETVVAAKRKLSAEDKRAAKHSGKLTPKSF